jgi:uncharacterized protein (TIGR03083 family)
VARGNIVATLARRVHGGQDGTRLRTSAGRFREQTQVFLDLVDDTEDLATPTALGEWDCATLIGHASTAVEGLFRWLGPRTDHDDEIDAVSWWDVSAAIADVNADFATRYAAKRTHQQIRDLVKAAVQKGNETVAVTAADATLLLPAPGAWARFDQGLSTRVFELTVHGIDLASATGSEREPSPAALSVVAAILDERLEGDRPADAIADLEWVLAATGRVEHSDSRLPVIH